jgi:hypothetical protein
MQAVAELLAEAGVAPAQPRARLAPAGADASIVAPLRRLMAHVNDANFDTYLARNQELSFLANALLAGCSVYDRPLTIQEAWDAAIGVCNIGLQTWTDGENVAAPPEPFLAEHDLVTAFETGWRLLYEDVSLSVCDRLIATLADGRHLLYGERWCVRGARARPGAQEALEANRDLRHRRGPLFAACSANARYCPRSCRRCSPAARAR